MDCYGGWIVPRVVFNLKRQNITAQHETNSMKITAQHEKKQHNMKITSQHENNITT